MIILHQYPGSFGLPSLSPFCIKVELFLKLSDIPYEVKVELNPSRGPKGKMPFIEDGKNVISDSSFIIEYLIKTYSLHHFDVGIPRLAAEAYALKTMIEESLYFILLYSRWVDEEGYRIIEKEFSPLFPFFTGKPILRLIRRSLVKQAMAQGTGRHKKEEVYLMGTSQIDALSDYLGDREYFFEDKISVFDLTCYSFLSTILQQPIESPLKVRLEGKENLCHYINRISDLVLKK